MNVEALDAHRNVEEMIAEFDRKIGIGDLYRTALLMEVVGKDENDARIKQIRDFAIHFEVEVLHPCRQYHIALRQGVENPSRLREFSGVIVAWLKKIEEETGIKPYTGPLRGEIVAIPQMPNELTA